MAGQASLFLEKMGYTHYVAVETIKGKHQSKWFGVCLERENLKEHIFFRKLKKQTDSLPQSLSIIETSSDNTHRVRFIKSKDLSNRRTFRTFSVSLPGYSSRDIARELYRFCMGGNDPKW